MCIELRPRPYLYKFPHENGRRPDVCVFSVSQPHSQRKATLVACQTRCTEAALNPAITREKAHRDSICHRQHYAFLRRRLLYPLTPECILASP